MNLGSWFVELFSVGLLAWHFRHGPWPWYRFAGIGFSVVGVLLIATARYQLGRSFSVAARARELVKTGLYSRVRNPIYLAWGFLLLGQALYLISWWPLVLLGVLLPIQWKRSQQEATVLEAAFGDEYRSYRAKTWM